MVLVVFPNLNTSMTRGGDPRFSGNCWEFLAVGLEQIVFWERSKANDWSCKYSTYTKSDMENVNSSVVQDTELKFVKMGFLNVILQIQL